MLKGWWPEMGETLPSDGGGHHLLNTHISLSMGEKARTKASLSFPLGCTLPPLGVWLCSVMFLYSKYPQAGLTVTTSQPTFHPRVSLSCWPPLPLIRNGQRRRSGED